VDLLINLPANMGLMKISKTIIAVLFFFVAALGAAAQKTWRFDLGNGKLQPGYIAVTTASEYTEEKGYGFEFSSGLRSADAGLKDALKTDYISSDKPFYFSVKLPEGNYKVEVLLGDAKAASATTIKAECRRLMVEKIETAKGNFTKAVFNVHIRDSFIAGGGRVRLKPREREYLHWDNKLTLEFNNTGPKVCAVEITPASNLPTIFLAGNSTVVDQSAEPWASWGQMIPAFFAPGKAVIANYAESGETLKSFKGAGRLQKIWSLAKKGDYLLIEFAHNDQKPGGNHLDPYTTYQQTLKEWIAEARKRGVTPILVTSVNRRSFDSSGQISNSLGDYPDAVRQLAQTEKVDLIDLNAQTKTLYEAMGVDGSIKAFVHFAANTYPNQPRDVKDNTHFSSYGAYEIARAAVEEIKKNIPSLAKLLRKDLQPFDAAHPDSFETFALPPSSFVGIIKPDGN